MATETEKKEEQDMSEEVKSAKKTAKKEAIFIPRGSGNEEQQQFISVNGVNVIVPKGKEVMVSPEVAEEYRRSLRAQARLDRRIDELQEAGRAPVNG